MRATPTITLLTGTLLLLSCHSSPPTPAAAPVTDACAVLTPTEISAVLNVPIDPGKHIPQSSNIMCSWSQSGATGEVSLKLVLNFTNLDAFQREKASTSPRVALTPTSGIGDDAFYVTTEFGTSLFVRKGKTAIGFSVRDRSLPNDQLMAMERTLGLNAAARL